MSASDGDDGGLTIIPLGPGSGAAARASQEIPDWVKSLRPLAALTSAAIGTLVAFAQNPVEFVFRLINYYVVGGALAVGRFAVGVVLAPFDLLGGALDYLQRALVNAFAVVGIDILGVLVGIQQSIAGVVASAGPAGPLVAVGLAAVSIYLLYRLAIAALEIVPGGSSILTLGGFR